MAVSTLEKTYYVSLWEAAEEGTSDYPAHSVYQLITSPINQMGKTTFSLTSASLVLQQLHGRRFDIDNIHFEVPEFMERRETINEWDHQILDEPQRPAGNRKWQTPENQVLAEALLTSNYWHKHVHLPTPHVHLVDSQIYGVATSHVVITSLGHATIYSLKRGSGMPIASAGTSSLLNGLRCNGKSSRQCTRTWIRFPQACQWRNWLH